MIEDSQRIQEELQTEVSRMLFHIFSFLQGGMSVGSRKYLEPNEIMVLFHSQISTIICVTIGTIFLIVFVIKLIRGKE